MPNTWIRFKYMDPIQIVDRESGVPTGESILYLRAVRSDAMMYESHVKISDHDAAEKNVLREAREQLRNYLERFLDEHPTVEPLFSLDAFRGQDGWVEAA